MSRSTMMRWLVQFRAPELVLRRAANRGDLAARMASDRSMWADPFPAYDELRSKGELVPGRVVYASASHAVVSEVLRSPQFRVGIRSESLPRVARFMLSRSVDPRAVGPVDPPSMLAVDPPSHTRYRRLVSKVFTARSVAALEPRIEKLAHELADAMEGRDVVDLVETYAAPLPVAIIAEILGVPQHMHRQLLDWGNAAAVTLDPALTYAQFRNAAKALREMHDWLDRHLAELRRNPGDDLMSKLATLEDAGEHLDDVELRATALLVTGAGFETTVNLIGNAVALLAERRDQLQRLQADPTGWENAIDEALRHESPVQVTVRHAAEDTEVCGHPVLRGQLVTLMLGGANRDPEVFAEPDRYDAARPNAREHLAFSGGIHYCLGASLARLEGSVALRVLFERFPDLQLAGNAVRRPTRVLRGYERLPVRLSA